MSISMLTSLSVKAIRKLVSRDQQRRPASVTSGASQAMRVR